VWGTTVTSSVLHSIPTFRNIVSSSSQAKSSASHPSLPPLFSNSAIFTGTNPALPPYPQDIPVKIIKKILNLECIDMADLIQENWEMEESDALENDV